MVKMFLVKSNACFQKSPELRAEANCTTGEKRSLSITVYKTDGSISKSSQASAWSYVTPDTVGESQHNYVCAR